MDEQDLNSSIEEVAPHETDQDVSQHDNDNTVNAQAQAREEAKERDWRNMRQRQKEMEYAIQQKDELINRFLQQQQPQSKQEPVEEEEPDEEYVPAGKVKGIARRTVQPLEKKIHELEQKIAQQEQQKLMSSLRTQYSDFDDIVNVETLDMLEKNEPELAATIAQFKDPYKMGLHSYKYIKALGLTDKLPESRRSKEIAQKLDKNSKAVQSPTAYEKRPMAQAYKSSQVDSTALYEEMMHYASKANGY
jgi:hypothetical protein